MNLKHENQQTPSHHFSSISFHQYHSSILLLEAIILSISWCQSKGVSSTLLNIWIWSHCHTTLVSLYIYIHLVNWCCEYMPIAISKSLRHTQTTIFLAVCCIFTTVHVCLQGHAVIILALLTGCNFPWRTERDELEKWQTVTTPLSLKVFGRPHYYN